MEPRPAASSSVARWVVIGAGFLGFLAQWAVVAGHKALYDTDAYFHLAVARRYAAGLIRGGLPWTRFSVMGDGFGDKEILFHLLLAPFAAAFGAVGGRFALALLNGLVAALIARLAVPVFGAWAAVAPLWLLASSFDYLSRMMRLRPELLLLAFLLLAVDMAARGRYRSLAIVAFLLTWSHTGFAVLIPLGAAWALSDRLGGRRFTWPLLLYPAAGIAAALVAHPQFPHNLVVWWVQNVERYRLALPDQGGEFTPNTLASVLSNDASWLLGVAALLVYRPAQDERRAHSPLARRLLVAALATAALFGMLSRFATLFVPLATLAALHHAGAVPVPRAFGRSAVAARWAAGALALASLLLCVRAPRMMAGTLADSGIHLARYEPDGRAFGRLIPRDARVAAAVSDTQFYVFFAPWGRYLDVLDPAFMAVPHPVEYAAMLRVFGGSEPDVPLALATTLQSDYLALFDAGSRLVGRRLAHDPRATGVAQGSDTLFMLRPDHNRDFVLDWVLASPDPGTERPRSYPRAGDERGRALEGFVDLGRMGARQECIAVSHVVKVDSPTTGTLELAPYGPAALSVDDRLVLDLRATTRAVLGDGALVPLALDPGMHTLTVRSCPAEGVNGFYLLTRGGSALATPDGDPREQDR